MLDPFCGCGTTVAAAQKLKRSWIVGLVLDFVPGGVDPVSGTDNIVYDIQSDGTSPSGWGHPECATASTTIGDNLPNSNPVSPPPVG